MDEATGRDIPLEEMVGLVDPGWSITCVEPAGGGFSSVFELTVASGTDSHTVFLKSPANDEPSGIAADARITALLDRQTTIPVPEILGLVETHPEYPTPYYVSSSMPGRQLPYEEVGWLPDAPLRGITRHIGAFLGELHQLDAVDRFGHVTEAGGVEYSGDPPAGTVDELCVREGEGSWPEYLRGRVDFQLDRLAGTRFESLQPDLSGWFHDEIDDLAGPFDPVPGRNDHGLHNLLVDPETGSVTAMLDWAYTLAVPPAFDVEFTVYLFSGAFLSGITEVPDRRDLVRKAVLDGYRSTAPELAAAVEDPSQLYEMMARLRILTDFELLAPRLPEGTEETVADTLRGRVESVLSGGESPG